MSESIRDIRARTRARIEELDAKREAEIRDLKDKHARDLEALRRESRAKEEEVRSRIVALEKKQAEQISRGLREMAEETKRLKETLQRQLDARVKDLEAEVDRREKKLQAEIGRCFEDFKARQEKLMRMIADQTEKERLNAEVRLRQAERDLSRISGAELVQTFQAVMLQHHRSAYEQIQALIDDQQWPAVAGAALLLSTQCIRTEAQAEADFGVWKYWNEQALTPVRALLARLQEAEVAAWSFRRGELSYVCAPLLWNEEALRELIRMLKETEAPLCSVRPRCAVEEMKRIWSETPGYQVQVELALEQAETRVDSFLLMAQVLDALTTEVPWVMPDWAVSEDAALQEIDVLGTMAFQRTGGSYGEMQVTIRCRSDCSGGLTMCIAYDGTRTQAVRRGELIKLCSELTAILSSETYGGIELGAPSEFVDDTKVCVNITIAGGAGAPGTWMPGEAEAAAADTGTTAGRQSGDERKGVAGV